MIINDLLEQLKERFPTTYDKKIMVDNLFKKREELHICDLDLSLIFLGIALFLGTSEQLYYFRRHDELIMSIVDSSYAKYFAPHLFISDVTTVDDAKRNEELFQAVKDGILNCKFAKETGEAILNHELLKSIDVRLLDTTKSKIINASDIIKIEVHCNNAYSFALSQTSFKIINDIVLTNLSDNVIKDAELVITSDPNYVEISKISVPLINPHQPISVTEFNINPHLEQLMELQEKVIGTLTVKLTVGDETLASLTTEINYLSYDTWLERVMSGSTALFVTPNEVSVQNAVGLVAKEMQKLTGDSSLPDYQYEDKNNVISQLKALYNTLHKEAIAYITIPPSYENNFGQKIRLPHDVLVHKQGTCLDLSILFIACAERMGLNPFLVIISGHAFAGVFLEESNFPSMIYYDAPHALEMNSEEENRIVFVLLEVYRT